MSLDHAALLPKESASAGQVLGFKLNPKSVADEPARDNVVWEGLGVHRSSSS